MKEFKHIDLTYLKSVSDGNNDLIIELIEIFKSQIPEFNSYFDEYYNTKQWYQLGLVAHKAKSSVSVMGMSNLSKTLKKFELEAKNEENIENYSKYINDFKLQTQYAIVELDNYLLHLKK